MRDFVLFRRIDMLWHAVLSSRIDMSEWRLQHVPNGNHPVRDCLLSSGINVSKWLLQHVPGRNCRLWFELLFFGRDVLWHHLLPLRKLLLRRNMHKFGVSARRCNLPRWGGMLPVEQRIRVLSRVLLSVERASLWRRVLRAPRC